MKRVIGLAIFLLVSIAFTRIDAQTTGDQNQGFGLAQQVCSECHAIQKDKASSPNPQAPAFVELATASGMTIAALTVALTTPHAGMPMFKFTPEQRDDVIAYILSLR